MPRKPFLKRHRWIVPIFGAVVVFATSVYKEEKRDKVEKLLDSIESSENMLILRSDNWQMSVSLQTVQNLLGFSSLRESEKPGDKSYQAATAAMFTQCNSLSSLLDGTSRLVQALPNEMSDKHGLEEKLHNLTDKNTSICDEFENVESIEKKMAAAADTRPSVETFISGIDKDRFQTLLTNLHQVILQADSLKDTALDEAKQVRTLNQNEYRNATNVSHGLFVLGWVIGIVGTFLGIGAGGGEESG